MINNTKSNPSIKWTKAKPSLGNAAFIQIRWHVKRVYRSLEKGSTCFKSLFLLRWMCESISKYYMLKTPTQKSLLTGGTELWHFVSREVICLILL